MVGGVGRCLVGGGGGWRQCWCSIVVVVGANGIGNDGGSDARGCGVVNRGRLLGRQWWLVVLVVDDATGCCWW